MATTSFGNLGNQETKAQESAAPQLPAKQERQELAPLPQPTGVPAGIEGELERSDIKLPRINLVQKTSELFNHGFRHGDIVYNREIALAKPCPVVVVRLKKQYQQELPYGGDAIPHVCDTLQEVREAGGSIEWGAENRYSELAHMQLLVQAPDNIPDELADLFPYEIDGKSWAPAMFTVAKSAYKSAAKPVITAAFNSLRGGLGNGLWHLTSETKKNAMGSWETPVMKMVGRTSPEMAELVASLNAGA